MPLIRETDLRAIANRAKTDIGSIAMRQRLEEAVRKGADDTYDVFLSHSFDDRDIIYALYTLLCGQGLKVYVDWIEDSRLNRTRVTPATAAILRSRMRRCASLVYAASDTSPDSKWMPWELGYFDGLRGAVAILPVTATGGSGYADQEYLGLYPYITAHELYGQPTNLRVRTEAAAVSAPTIRDWVLASKR